MSFQSPLSKTSFISPIKPQYSSVIPPHVHQYNINQQSPMIQPSVQFQQPLSYFHEIHHNEHPLQVVTLDDLNSKWKTRCLQLEQMVFDLQLEINKQRGRGGPTVPAQTQLNGTEGPTVPTAVIGNQEIGVSGGFDVGQGGFNDVFSQLLKVLKVGKTKELEQKIQQLQTDNENLQKQLQEQTAKSEELNQQLSDALQKIELSTNQVGNLQKDLESVEDEIRKKNNEIMSLQGELQKKDEEISKIKSDLESLQEEYDNAQEELNKIPLLETEKAQLTKKLRDASAEVSNLQEEMTKLKTELEATKKKLSAASSGGGGEGVRQSTIRASQVQKQAGGGDRRY